MGTLFADLKNSPDRDRTPSVTRLVPASVAAVLLCVLPGAPAPTTAEASPISGEGKVPTQTLKIPHGTVTRFGLYQQRVVGWTQKDAASATGKVIRNATLEFKAATRRIPLRRGTVFGYQYWVKLPAEDRRPHLKRVLIHPPMVLPGGSTVSRSERWLRKRATYGIVTAVDAYALSEDYELVEGDWIFQLWYGQTLLVEQRFTTYRPPPEVRQVD